MRGPAQAGAYRTIHPVLAPVQRIGAYPPQQERQDMDRPDQYYTVEKDEVRDHVNGRGRMRFYTGARIDRALAAQYGFIDAEQAAYARPDDEKPDIAATDELPEIARPEKRAKGAAPENRAKGKAPGGATDTGLGWDQERKK
jgi:hypothetical protein